MRTIQLKKTEDERGNLVINTDENLMLSSKHFFIAKSKSGAIRGNHYHNRKSEWFCVVEGVCKIVVEDIVNHSREELIVKDSDNLAVCMEPGKAHAMENIGKGPLILLALVNEVLNDNDPDTFPYKVI